MREAIVEAKLALAADEVPIGCVVYHAPPRIASSAAGTIGVKRNTIQPPTPRSRRCAGRPNAATLAVDRLHPRRHARALPKCTGGMVNAKIPNLIYGCDDPKAGAVEH